MLKILADQAIPNAKEIFSTFGEVELKYGRDIQPCDLQGVDALIVRSVTKVNDELLAQADKLQFVGTATAGVDHIDIPALDRRNIKFAAAHGCNARSVADYVLCVWMVLAQRYGLDLSQMSIGIVGMGHVGARVYRRAQALGMKIVCSDPIRAHELKTLIDSMQDKANPAFGGNDVKLAAVRILAEGDARLCDLDLADPELYDHTLEEVLACDIVSLHVPLTELRPSNIHPTFHMIGKEQLESMRDGQILINTSRGAVVDNQALYDLLSARPGCIHAWLDVFENEPNLIVPDLVQYLEGSTAHIAGYALEAKNRGTEMVAKAMIKALNLPYQLNVPRAESDIARIELSPSAVVNYDLLSRIIFSIYDVRRDDSLFRTKCFDGPSFDQLRKDYQERHEFDTVKIKTTTPEQLRLLYRLGFNIQV